MRLLIINRIMLILTCNGGGNPNIDYVMDLRGNRFKCVYEFVKEHNDKGWNPPKRYKDRIFVTESDLDMLADDRLIELFEMVVRRANVCM